MTHLQRFLRPGANLSPSVLSDALRAVREHLDMPVAFLSTFEGDEVCFRTVSHAPEHGHLRSGDRLKATETFCHSIREGVLPPLIRDTADHPEAQALRITHEMPIRACISIPVQRRDGSIYGMFCCLSPDPMPNLNMRDHKLMAMFASLAAEAVVIDHDEREDIARLRSELRNTISATEFDIYLQPILDLASGKTIGAEALTRFRPEPKRGPEVWFRDARRCDMQQALELATLRKSLSLLGVMPESHLLSVNASAALVGSGILLPIVEGLPTGRLIIELTEHEEIANLPALQTAVADLRDLGVRVAIDDLGAGYAGLASVLKLKPDVLKMDRALVRGIDRDPAAEALASSLVHFARALGARLVAEGIERWEEAEKLAEIGVSHGQGYLLGRPDAADRYLRWAA